MQKFIFNPFKLFSLLIFGVGLLASQQVQAQCCTNEVYGSPGFEGAFTQNSRFPSSTYATTSNATQAFSNVNGFDTYAAATGFYIINDATRASEGSNFFYLPPSGSSGTPTCLSAISALTYSTSCATYNAIANRRYVVNYDFVAFNRSDPTGNSSKVSYPTVETYTQAFDLLNTFSMYDSTKTIIGNKGAVHWNSVKTSWLKASALLTLNTTVGYIFLSIPNGSTSGALLDNLSFKLLQMTAPGVGTVNCDPLTGTKRVFTLDPVSNIGNVPNISYNVTAPSGYTISPTTGIYGQPTTFTLTRTSGTAIGTGNVSLTLTDPVNTSCTLAAVIPDPLPTATFTKTTQTCSNGSPNNDGVLTLTAFTNADKFGISTGASYTGPAYASATAIGTLPFVVKTAVPNAATTYTVRMFYGNCYKDFVTTFAAVNCPNAGPNQTPVCSGSTPITTTTLAATALAGASWTQAATNPAGAAITTTTSATSTVTGLTPGIFSFIWGTTSLKDTVQVTIPDCNPPVTSCDTTLTVTNATICNGASTDLFALANGVKGTLTYSTDGTTWASLVSPTNVTPSVTTTYFVKDTLTNGCFDIDTLVITVNPTPTTPSVSTPQIANCPATTIDLTALSAALTPSVVGGVFEWHVSNSSSSAIVSNQTAVVSGTYYLFEKSSAGCYSTGKAVEVQVNCCPPNTCVPITIVRN